ncbi:MAG: hypothetical protein EPO10_28880 [Reyranella sp.]|uniref:hypothetical protein n=1 Tax=Enhydrobacter aerosaccus TaxID=225324 RepID=UPI0011163BEA|nr:hypothetical protein [Enhydrobacter aerosaccus]TBR22028.1 MAG: hypothetical protein EPO10_28880 [Reyranella sp.]
MVLAAKCIRRPKRRGYRSAITGIAAQRKSLGDNAAEIKTIISCAGIVSWRAGTIREETDDDDPATSLEHCQQSGNVL